MSAPDPVTVPCPACQSAAGARCTQPDDNGRHEVKTTHISREVAAQDAYNLHQHALKIAARIAKRNTELLRRLS